MNKTRIALDVDGVLRDFVGQIATLIEQETGHTVPAPEEYYYDTLDQTGISFRKRIWETGEWLEPVFVDAPVLPKAKEAYNMLCDNENFQVHIVTAQSEGTEEYTSRWLRNNGFDKHHDIVFTNKKLSAPCQVIIDDKPSNIKDYVSGARMGILMDTTYNRKFDHSPRVTNLIEAYKILAE